MTCIKTGAHALILAYGEFVYGDAFELGGVLLLRIVEIRREPIYPLLHFRVGEPAHWFDRQEHTSTLAAIDWINLGYHGVPVTEGEKT